MLDITSEEGWRHVWHWLLRIAHVIACLTRTTDVARWFEPTSAKPMDHETLPSELARALHGAAAKTGDSHAGHSLE